MADNDRRKEILAGLGQLMLDREELVRQLQILDQKANRLKIELVTVDSNWSKSNGE
jgi:hypothetical protein